MGIPHANVGDEVEIRVNDRVGWVDGVVSYAYQGSFIVDTKEHSRFSLSTLDHPDLRPKPKAKK